MSEEKRKRLYRALRSRPDWMTRRELALLTGVKRLSSADALYIDVLAQEGKVEIEKARRIGAIGFEYRYRTIEVI